MNAFYGYIRVSTERQGVQGASLVEQKDAILRHAARKGSSIVEWFEEHETAAKIGRPVFDRMVRLLKSRKADGVVIHKIDRSARNLHDWVALTSLLDLADLGIDVQSAADDLDLKTRSGRMTADILAVMAADYIRNLKEEVRKGFDGRLKQGLYPGRAPLGYLDKGPGKVKEWDPIRAPLVRKLFELYGTNHYGLKRLQKEITALGLRSHTDRVLSLNSISRILNNPFYMGLLQLKGRELYPGIHKPLVTSTLFNRVQAILRRKTNTKVVVHPYLFRRMLRCALCGHSLTGERQKGHVYYRCHDATCPTKTIREEGVALSMERIMSTFNLSTLELRFYRGQMREMSSQLSAHAHAERTSLMLQLEKNKERMARLTDALLDQTIEKDLFEERKTDLLMSRAKLQERLSNLDADMLSLPQRALEFFELIESASIMYQMGFTEQKRDLLKLMTSNRVVTPNEVVVEPAIPFSYLSKCLAVSEGGGSRGRLRTCKETLTKILDWIKQNPEHEMWEKVHKLLERKPERQAA